MKITERYSAAVNSDNLSVDERTTWSDSDVLGAAGLAARYEPLGVALTRLFADGKAEATIAILTEMAFKRARTLQVRFSWVELTDLSKAVLGWYRHGICQPCGGTGYQMIPDTPVQGDECPHCRAAGRLDFNRMFDRGLCDCCGGVGVEIEGDVAYVCSACDGGGAKFLMPTRASDQLALARWLSGEIDRSQVAAGRAAMAMLASRLEL